MIFFLREEFATYCILLFVHFGFDCFIEGLFTSSGPVEQMGEMGSRRRFGGGESERF